MHESDERRVAEAEESAAPTTPAGGLRGVLVAASALLAAAQDRLTELETRDRERDQVLKRSQDTIRIYRANAEEYGDGVREAEAEIKALLDEADTQGITLDEEVLNYALGKSLVRLGRTLLRDPADRNGLKRLVAAVQLLDLLPFHVNIWDIQNVIYSVMTLHFPTIRDMAEKGEASLLEWVREFRFLASKLYIAIE